MAKPVKVLFVCLHGSAKSVIAAEHFRRLALDAGTEADADSAGVEPDDEIPAHVVHGLADDGFDVKDRMPRRLTEAAIADAGVVVSLGCSLDAGPPAQRLVRWDDIPAVSDGYGPARDAIVGRLRTLLADMSLEQPDTAPD